MSTTDRLVVAIDFGTTFTGVAAAYSGTPDKIEIVKTWPGANGRTSDKVPTEFTYNLQTDVTPAASANPPIPSLVPLKEIRWGYQLKPDEDRVTCIKLFLDRNQQFPDFVDPLHSAMQLAQNQRTFINAVADFLAQVRAYAFLEFQRRYGEDFMASTPMHYVFTVPAVWSDTAKDATLQAANRAGMGKFIRMISEPEAGALYTTKIIQPNHLRVGDVIVVCDAGGGTVDIISYRITRLDPLAIEEAEVGTGGLYGSAFLNYRFESHMKSRLGDDFEKIKTEKPRTWVTAMKEFETYIKRQFDGDANTEYSIPFPGVVDDAALGIDQGFLTIKGSEIQEIFEPVITGLTKLVDGQIESLHKQCLDVSALILIGGFGQSSYVFQRLQRSLRDKQRKRKIEIMQPIDAWTAVVRGAVLRGLEGSTVATRKCRFHYGNRNRVTYDKTLHAGLPKIWDHLEGEWKVLTMRWYITKGEKVSDKRRIRAEFYRTFSCEELEHKDDLESEDQLYACNDTIAPMQPKQDFQKVCRVSLPLATVPTHEFKPKTGYQNQRYYELDYSLIMAIDSANISFTLEVDGEEYGKAVASFDHDTNRPPQWANSLLSLPENL